MIHSRPMPAKKSGSIRLSESERAALLDMAGKLGATIGGRPSLARLMGEIAAGSVALVRVRAYRPASRAAQIRAFITDRPGATNAEIGRELGLSALYVAQIRSRDKSKGPGRP